MGLVAGCGGRDELEEARADGVAECARYLECSLQVSADSVVVLLEAFGPDGTCWDTEERSKIDFCRRTCISEREKLYSIFDTVAACGPCVTSEDCKTSALPVCDVFAHECVECLSSVECRDPALPFCDNHSCVACVDGGDCPEGQVCSFGACRVPTKVCEPGALRCAGEVLERCDELGAAWATVEDCAEAGEVCDPERLQCGAPVVCAAGTDFCQFDDEEGVAEVRRCNADGTASTRVENCVAAGRTCYEGTCVVTEYGPCGPNGPACAKGGDICVEHGTGMPEVNNDPYYYYCSSECDGYECPDPLPPGPDDHPGCDTGQCLLGCNHSGPDECPPGMRCAWDGYTSRCGWATWD